MFDGVWHQVFMPFRNIGTEILMLVSSDCNKLMTCDPAAAHFILRESTFGKPTKLLSQLNIFRPTITESDGAEARPYRKIVTPFFNERTMAEMWRKTVLGANALMQTLGVSREELRPILARLTLYLLNNICFEGKEDCLESLTNREPVPAGHQMSYRQAMAEMLECFPVVSHTPRKILGNSA